MAKLTLLNVEREGAEEPTTGNTGTAQQTGDSTESKAGQSGLTAFFPTNVPIHKNYMIFRAVDPGVMTSSSLRSRQNNFISNPNSMDCLASVCMYMPAMNENLSHSYAKSETDLLSELAGIAVNSFANGQSMPDGGDAVEGAIQFGANKFLTGAADAAKKKAKFGLLKTAANAATQSTGIIMMNRQNFLYNGTAPRTQTFVFNLRPSNPTELREIGKIVNIFRTYSSATRGNFMELVDTALGTDLASDKETSDFAYTIRVPPVWFIEERINQDPNHTTRLGRSTDRFFMGPAGITNVRVNKTPDNIYQTVMQTSGDPISIELEITFQEMIPNYAEFWNSVRGNSIVEATQ